MQCTLLIAQNRVRMSSITSSSSALLLSDSSSNELLCPVSWKLVFKLTPGLCSVPRKPVQCQLLMTGKTYHDSTQHYHQSGSNAGSVISLAEADIISRCIHRVLAKYSPTANYEWKQILQTQVRLTTHNGRKYSQNGAPTMTIPYLRYLVHCLTVGSECWELEMHHL